MDSIRSKLFTENDIDSCQKKIFDYLQNEKGVFFDDKDCLCLTYLWIGINNEKAMYVIRKLMPDVFNECLDDKDSTWDSLINKLLDNMDRFLSILFKIILMDVTWEIFKNSNQKED